MTSTEKFIRASERGGFRHNNHKDIHVFDGSPLRVGPSIQVEYHDGYRERVPISEFLMNQEFWRCARATLGWKEYSDEYLNEWGIREEWVDRWHGLLDALADGKTAEDYLATLITSGKENV